VTALLDLMGIYSLPNPEDGAGHAAMVALVRYDAPELATELEMMLKRTQAYAEKVLVWLEEHPETVVQQEPEPEQDKLPWLHKVLARVGMWIYPDCNIVVELLLEKEGFYMCDRRASAKTESLLANLKATKSTPS
jgi:hypothetical protein